jgi:alpha-L-glutamate ligase-like protein
MFWLFGARRLAELGILGMNHRNASCILEQNPRVLFPVVDDKRRMHELCGRIGVPTPELYGTIEQHSELRGLMQLLAERTEFVIKPNRGSAGRGVLVIAGREQDLYLRHNDECLTLEDLQRHIADILSGMYSLGGQPDQALIQYRVQLHPMFAPISYRGIPDIRIVLYRNEPMMAMLRLPTRESNGRANLHQGGIGAGIDLATGVTHHAVQYSRFVEIHPNTGESVLGCHIPYWGEVLDMAQRVARAVGLGYVGVDIVIDAELGPMLLEANARPGLAIQMANGSGLLPRLELET